MRFTGAFDVRVCVTAQHRDMLDQVLRVFDVVPDYDLGAMRTGQTLTQSTARIVMGLEDVLRDERPALILVQGDTTTTFCGALAAFYAGVPTAHVEAGLRTFDMQAPFPEEMNRVIVGRLPRCTSQPRKRPSGTSWQRRSRTGHRGNGQHGIDALLQVEGMLRRGTIESGRSWRELDPSRRLILVTAHRRESFGAGVEQICAALAQIARMHDVQIVYPVHPNPNVSGPVREKLSGVANILLLEPLDYVRIRGPMGRS
jgi:UDP-N-acetylglucosamine 2-epimerase (non-hydrolysing)